MPKTYVIDIRHYLDERGKVAKMPAPALAIALFCGAVVAWVTGWPGPRSGDLTNGICRRSRARPPCSTEVYARLRPGGAIEWRCPACGEQGTISGWQGTRWDQSGT